MKIFFIERLQLKNVEGIKLLEYHYFAYPN